MRYARNTKYSNSTVANVRNIQQSPSWYDADGSALLPFNRQEPLENKRQAIDE